MNIARMDDGTHSIEVSYDEHISTDDLADLLEFKSKHITAKANPEIFRMAAERLRALDDTIEQVCCGGGYP